MFLESVKLISFPLVYAGSKKTNLPVLCSQQKRKSTSPRVLSSGLDLALYLVSIQEVTWNNIFLIPQSVKRVILDFPESTISGFLLRMQIFWQFELIIVLVGF